MVEGINAPYKFNFIFQEYIDIVNRTETGFISKKETLEPVLDKLLSEFPDIDFSKIYYTYLEWDDTTRLCLDLLSGKKQYELIKELEELFWMRLIESIPIYLEKQGKKPSKKYYEQKARSS